MAKPTPTKPMSSVQELRVSVGAYANKPAPEAKTTGTKMRGTGAATKGVMSRGPMA